MIIQSMKKLERHPMTGLFDSCTDQGLLAFPRNVDMLNSASRILQC